MDRTIILLRNRRSRVKAGGYTLLEMLVIVVILGVLAAIAAPGWLYFLERQRLSDAQDRVFQAIGQAHRQAQQESRSWQFSLREGSDGFVEWATHSVGSTPSNWQSLPAKSIAIDSADTTLDGTPYQYIRFNFKGNLESARATLTLTSDSAPSLKRCVVVSTLLGHLRKGEEHSEPNGNGRYCY